MSKQSWQIQDAKNRFSELVRKANEEGPQTVTRHGHEEVVVMSVTDYRKLSGRKENIVRFFRKSPLADVTLDLNRDRSPSRNIDL